MTKRSPLAVLLLSIVTLGIYYWYWSVKTKTELNQRGAGIPTAWIWLIPVVGSLYWLVKYSQGVGRVSSGRMSTAVSLILLLFLGAIGGAILQSTYNTIA